MFQIYGQTKLGIITVSTEGLVDLVSRHLPKGTYCSAVRFRSHDGLCLVMINDRREFWSREDDMRRARAIAADIKSLGHLMPRVQWVRQGISHPEIPLSEHPVVGSAFFWTLIALCIYMLFVLSWQSYAFFLLAGFCSWRLAAWLISEGGWNILRDLLPMLRRVYR